MINLDLSFNMLTGNPFNNLRILDLSDNEFTGYLPIQYFNNMKPVDTVIDYYNLCSKSRWLITIN